MNRLRFLLAIVAWVAAPVLALADEPAEAFLEALRDNGYYDIATDYLKKLETNDNVSPEFKSTLPFELAKTLIGSTADLPSSEQKEARLDEAQRLLTQFASGNQSLEQKAKAYRYQGDLSFRRSSIYLQRSKSDRLTAGEKAALFDKTRAALKISIDSYTNAKSSLKRLLDPSSPDGILVDPTDPSTRKKRDQFRAIYTVVRSGTPRVIERLADTYDENDPQRNERLLEAAEEYKKVWDAYPKFIAGIRSCTYAARCYQKLGEHQQALNLLAEIFALGNASVFRPVKKEAYVLAVDSWSMLDPYPQNEVVLRLTPVVTLLNRVEVRDPQWLRVQLELAIAEHAKSVYVKQEGGSSREVKMLERSAAKRLRSIARISSPHRERAKELLSQWNVPLKDPGSDAQKAPENFADARQLALDIVSEIESLASDLADAENKRRSNEQPTSTDALQQRVNEIQTTINKRTDDAFEALELALQLVDDQTSRADINNVRFLQSYCFFVTKQYFESALIGEFLLAKYPTVAGTRQATRLLVLSYKALLNQAGDQDRTFEQRRLRRACTRVVSRWPGSSEAGTAASEMTQLLMRAKDFQGAEKYYQQIPSSSRSKSRIAVELGFQVWADYQAQIKSRPAAAESLRERVTLAKRLLKNGIASATKDNFTYRMALAALRLVDVHLELGEVDQAVEQLETANLALLDLIKLKHPTINPPSSPGAFNRSTYRAAVKTYLAAMGNGTDVQTWIDKTSGVIAAMQDGLKASNDAKDRVQLSQIYLLIARELKSNFADVKDPTEKKKFAASLADFLGSIEKESSDGRTVLWAGSTMLGVAESLSQSGLVAEAAPLFRQAESALTRAETIGFAGEKNSDVLVRELRRQRALALRGNHQYQAAIDQFVTILKQRPNDLTIQLDAAETLQMKGKREKSSSGYAQALKGSERFKDPKTKRQKNRIWGWERIVKATRSNPRFQDTFYDALFHLIECRLEYGILLDNKRAVVSALKEIANQRKRDATFGNNPKRKQRFEALESRANAAKK